MEFEKLANLNQEQQKEILSDLIQNDVSYWKKVLLLMAMIDENEDTELLDTIIEHKIEEINLANKKYGLNMKHNEVNSGNNSSHVSTLDKIVSSINNAKYAMACMEVLEILKFIPTEYYERINKKFIERLQQNADTTQSLSITRDTNFNDLNLSNETKELLSLVSNKFWTIDGKSVDILEIFNK